MHPVADGVMQYPGLWNRHPRAPASHAQAVLACVHEAQQAVIARAAAVAACVCLDNRAMALAVAQRMLRQAGGVGGEIIESAWPAAVAAPTRRRDAAVVLYALPGRSGGCALAAPAALSDYLPLPMVALDDDAYRLLTPAERPQSVGCFGQHLGPAADLVRLAALAALPS